MLNLNRKKLFLLDMDGTIYLDNILFEKSSEFLQYIIQTGGRYIFMTNNSSKSVADYVNKLGAMGISVTNDDFVTSTQALIVYLKKHLANKLLYALGTESFKKELTEAGLKITGKPSKEVECLVMGFDTELTFKKLDDASRLLTYDIGYIAANPDLVCPTAYGYVPDCGSISQILYNATAKKPIFIGKPQPEMAFLALSRTGFSKEETVIIGDRLYTDIACGTTSGIDTILVLSGESTLADIDKSDVVPTYVMQDISEVLDKISLNNEF